MIILCACNCGQTLESRGAQGRPRTFISGHQNRGARNSGYKGGRLVTSSGYVIICMPNYHRADSNGYVREHMLKIEEKLGRPLRLDEVVHHKNGIRIDNRLENLELMTRSSHMRLHRLGSGKYSNQICRICGSTNIRRDGIANGKQIFECGNTDCGKHWSVSITELQISEGMMTEND